MDLAPSEMTNCSGGRGIRRTWDRSTVLVTVTAKRPSSSSSASTLSKSPEASRKATSSPIRGSGKLSVLLSLFSSHHTFTTPALFINPSWMMSWKMSYPEFCLKIAQSHSSVATRASSVSSAFSGAN